jgi:hypothetical protein
MAIFFNVMGLSFGTFLQENRNGTTKPGRTRLPIGNPAANVGLLPLRETPKMAIHAPI